MPYQRRFRNPQPSDEAKRDAEATRQLGFKVHWIRPWAKDSGLTEEQFAEVRRTLAAGSPVCAGSDHSRLLVGYIDDANEPGGGKFFTRDSGAGGYREITYDWARNHIYDLFWVELPPAPQPADNPSPVGSCAVRP